MATTATDLSRSTARRALAAEEHGSRSRAGAPGTSPGDGCGGTTWRSPSSSSSSRSCRVRARAGPYAEHVAEDGRRTRTTSARQVTRDGELGTDRRRRDGYVDKGEFVVRRSRVGPKLWHAGGRFVSAPTTRAATWRCACSTAASTRSRSGSARRSSARRRRDPRAARRLLPAAGSTGCSLASST